MAYFLLFAYTKFSGLKIKIDSFTQTGGCLDKRFCVRLYNTENKDFYC